MDFCKGKSKRLIGFYIVQKYMLLCFIYAGIYANFTTYNGENLNLGCRKKQPIKFTKYLLTMIGLLIYNYLNDYRVVD